MISHFNDVKIHGRFRTNGFVQFWGILVLVLHSGLKKKQQQQLAFLVSLQASCIEDSIEVNGTKIKIQVVFIEKLCKNY